SSPAAFSEFDDLDELFGVSKSTSPELLLNGGLASCPRPAVARLTITRNATKQTSIDENRPALGAISSLQRHHKKQSTVDFVCAKAHCWATEMISWLAIERVPLVGRSAKPTRDFTDSHTFDACVRHFRSH